ncbi:MAG: hypothetical protein B7Y12_08060 [Rhizobiales bacterium 24-66-13]|jgi:hypothetical protein|uniref:DUF5330 domain-containing protein n=1 Tax=Roseixanthobacter finlandensis TaxID=3119922 RepID=UPI000BDB3035|nr:MAG: hypothetical protein B7Z45_03685 [Azorhizobium sp. 12-66-6]OYZ80157.1 MAG: hypothetical protein B7Y12_08060 [Rhizobiales bacterium 24-66-13]HQS09166.1 DUF5330 domain-containing protein [Xanthobacteraceae bacterium]HQS45841.1 DUF5330 domain-containing protein [Xanthobacteraceae bacterium]
MFFLIRMTFWLGLILLLLPIGTSSDGREVGPWQAFVAVQSAVADARGFCQRQPDACAVGGDMLVNLTEKAQVGIKWVADALGHARTDAAAPGGSAASHGLTPQDLVPGWGGEPAGTPAATPGIPTPLKRPA